MEFQPAPSSTTDSTAGGVSLRMRIVLLGLVLILPLVGLAISISRREAEQGMALARDRAAILAEMADRRLDDLMEKAETTVEVLASAVQTRSPKAEDCQVWLAGIRAGLGWSSRLLIADGSGRVLCASGEPLGHLADATWFRNAVESAEPGIGDFEVDPVTGRPQITVVHPLVRAGEGVAGVVALGIDPAAFNREIQAHLGSSGTLVTILDRAGTVVARFPREDGLIGRNLAHHPLVARVLRERQGVGEAAGLDGVPRLYAFRPFGTTSATVVVGIDKAPIVAPSQGRLWSDLTLIGAIVLACVAIALAGVEALLLRPLQRLQSVVAAIGRGDFGAAEGMQSNSPELARMAQGVAAMAGQLAARDRALTESAALYRLLTENADDIIIRHDLAGNCPYVSPACERVLGYPPERFGVNSADDHKVHPDDLPALLTAMRGLGPERPSAKITYRLRHRDGHYVWMESTMRLIAEPMADGAQVVASLRDVTERHRAEEALQESESRYRMLADNATDMITLRDAEHRGLYASPACRRMLGYEPEEFLGLSVPELIHPDDRDQFVATRAGISAERPVVRSVTRARRKDGRYIWTEGVMHWVAGHGGRPARIVSVVRDISLRREAEETADRLRVMLQDAIDAMQDGVSLFDSEERLVLVNARLRTDEAIPAGIHLPGATFEEMLRAYWGDSHADPAAFERYLVERIAAYRVADGTPMEVQSRQGRWFVNRHFRMRDGGTLLVTHEVTEIKRAQHQLEAARDEATAANQAKSVFLASMSHEIRTPMNGVLGFAELLLDSPLSPAQRQQVSLLRDAGTSLLAIINDILDLSKIEAGKMQFERLALDPAALAHGAVAILRAQIEGKGLAIRLDCDPDLPPQLEGDPTRIRQILTNLLSNALKFTEAGGITVRVGARPQADGVMLRFEVSDTGIGIPADRMHLLFRDFSQIDSSTTRRYGGTGLGLSICKRLAEAMGGAVGVTSSPGRGSSFWFTVLVQPARPAVGDEPVPAEPSGAPGQRILVAEDVPMNQAVIRAMLRAAGHHPTVVGNGREAVAAAATGAFDLLLMDMEMPDMDGLAATRAIRAQERAGARLPIIALTAHATSRDRDACHAAGMDDFMTKPVNRARLVAMLAKWSAAADPAGAGVRIGAARR
jgi:PAS domain S-box-containing protein